MAQSLPYLTIYVTLPSTLTLTKFLLSTSNVGSITWGNYNILDKIKSMTEINLNCFFSLLKTISKKFKIWHVA